jgi:hypothetical protein
MYHTFAVYILVFKDKDYIKIGMSGVGATRIKQIEPDWGKIDWEKSRYSIVLGKIAHNVESALKVILSSYRIFEAGRTGYTEIFSADALPKAIYILETFNRTPMIRGIDRGLKVKSLGLHLNTEQLGPTANR